MKWILFDRTPCGMTLAALPLLLLLLPDGIPFVEAACSVTVGWASNAAVSCDTCQENGGAGRGGVIVHDCTVTPDNDCCEITVDAEIDINQQLGRLQ